MRTFFKRLVSTLWVLPTAASADWDLSITPAQVQTELATPGVLEIRVANTDADASPAMDLQAGAIAALLPDYQIELLSGSCGPWRDETMPLVFPVTIPTARIAIPAITAGSASQCSYRFTARRADSKNFRLSFVPRDRPNAPSALIQIGALTDLGVTAALIQSRLENGQAVERYRVSVSNFGDFDVANYALGACFENFGSDIRMNFPGGCERVSNGDCFDFGFSFRAGAIAAGREKKCSSRSLRVKIA